MGHWDVFKSLPRLLEVRFSGGVGILPALLRVNAPNLISQGKFSKVFIYTWVFTWSSRFEFRAVD